MLQLKVAEALHTHAVGEVLRACAPGMSTLQHRLHPRDCFVIVLLLAMLRFERCHVPLKLLVAPLRALLELGGGERTGWRALKLGHALLDRLLAHVNHLHNLLLLLPHAMDV